MINIAAFFAYILYVVLFSILVKYGIHISFNIDTGFIGPAFLFHAILMILFLTGQNKK